MTKENQNVVSSIITEESEVKELEDIISKHMISRKLLYSLILTIVYSEYDSINITGYGEDAEITLISNDRSDEKVIPVKMLEERFYTVVTLYYSGTCFYKVDIIQESNLEKHMDLLKKEDERNAIFVDRECRYKGKFSDKSLENFQPVVKNIRGINIDFPTVVY